MHLIHTLTNALAMNASFARRAAYPIVIRPVREGSGIVMQATGMREVVRCNSGVWSGYLTAELVVRGWFGYRVA
jgi:hypothetical protein